jgi:hypothetical protein
MPDLAGIQKAVERFNAETVPLLAKALESLTEKLDLKMDENLAQAVNDVHELLDRLDGLAITLHIPKRK